MNARFIVITFDIIRDGFGDFAQQIFNEKNLAQKNSFDEALSVDCLSLVYRSVGCYFRSVTTERQIRYGTMTYNVSKVDYIITGDLVMAVSVTRAFVYNAVLSLESAFLLIVKKLHSLRYAVLKYNEICESHNSRFWSNQPQPVTKQVLFIWCRTIRDAYILEIAFNRINTDLSVLIMCVVCTDPRLYSSN